MSWNESEALFRLGRACGLAAASRATQGRYPPSLEFDIPPYAAVYTYRYHAGPGGRRFAVTADLVTAGNGRGLCADSGGRLTATPGRETQVIGAACDARAQTLVGDKPSPLR